MCYWCSDMGTRFLCQAVRVGAESAWLGTDPPPAALGPCLCPGEEYFLSHLQGELALLLLLPQTQEISLVLGDVPLLPCGIRFALLERRAGKVDRASCYLHSPWSPPVACAALTSPLCPPPCPHPSGELCGGG